MMRSEYPKPVSVFLKALVKETKKLTPEDDKELAAAIEANIFGRKEVQSRAPLTSSDSHFLKIWYAFIELIEAYNALADIVSLARFKPPKKLKVHPVRYLRFLNEAYLNEFYILCERIQTFLTIIGRLYKGDPAARKVEDAVELLKQAVHAQVRDLRRARGVHVHEKRYSISAPEFRRLELLRLLVEEGKEKHLKQLYRFVLQGTQRQTVKNFRTFNDGVRHILSEVFHIIVQLLLDKDGLIYPEKVKASGRT